LPPSFEASLLLNLACLLLATAVSGCATVPPPPPRTLTAPNPLFLEDESNRQCDSAGSEELVRDLCGSVSKVDDSLFIQLVHLGMQRYCILFALNLLLFLCFVTYSLNGFSRSVVLSVC
jgi:hypothetical protein